MRILHVVGARPNFMKIAPLLQELQAREAVENVLVHTGQHYDHGMSGSFFEDLGIGEPDLNLGIGSGTHAAQTAAMMAAMEPVLLEQRPDLLVVVGDVNSTIASALTAAKLHVPVAHLEAGLRSGDRRMPEEINRILTDQLSQLLLTPSADADENLLAEGIEPERIRLVGNIMIDTLLAQLDRARAEHPVEKFGLSEGAFVLVTLHRPSNVDVAEQLREIVTALEEIASQMDVLIPIHPRTARRMEEAGLAFQRVRVVPPVGYREMIALQAGAKVVVTDSGGVQEETTVLGTPCLTLRSSTERPITISEGTNRLVPVRSVDRILAAFAEALGSPREARRPEYWDGRTAERVADVFERWHDCGGGPG